MSVDEAPAILSPRAQEQRLQKIYGRGFPLLGHYEEQREAEMLQQWLKGQVEAQRPVMQDKRMHWSRHRLFRQGRQWITSRDGQSWRELPESKNRVRAVFNQIGPALDFRLSLLQEQRPGFKHTPIPGLGVQGRETALAQQSVVEWHFKTQNIWQLFLHGLMHAQTDGVCFMNVYICKESGPSLEEWELVGPEDSRYELLSAQGYEEKDGLLRVPLVSGTPQDAGTVPGTFKGGEIKTRLLLAHEVWADPEARDVNTVDGGARWLLSRRIRDLQSARIQLDDPDLEPDVKEATADPLDYAIGRQERGLKPYPGSRNLLPQGGIYENLVYLAPSEEMPEGKWVEIIGDRHMRQGDLPGGKIPIARLTDGSSDDEFFPRPVMSDWIGDQVTINALGSKLLEYARHHSGSKLLALQGTQVQETWTDIVGSMVEYKGAKPDVMPPPRASPDLWNLWTTTIRQLEDKTGWNRMARGQLTGEGGFQDVAGRAVLAARELFERQFGPMIRSASQGISDWSALVVCYAQYLYDQPRLIPMAGRPDLAKRIGKDLLSGPPSVYVEPETLQPLPRALRNQLLFDYLQAGLITVQEFKKRAPFAEVRDLEMGDSDQWARAQMVNTLLEEKWEDLEEMEVLEMYGSNSGLGIFWQDEPSVHMRALEEVILDDMQPFGLRKLAADRWGIYSELQETKSFPKELELQGFPRPPAPLEVFGVPNTVEQRPEPSTQQMMGGPGPGGGGGDPLGGAQGAAPAPELSGTAMPQSTRDSPQPLGSMGAAEAMLNQ